MSAEGENADRELAPHSGDGTGALAGHPPGPVITPTHGPASNADVMQVLAEFETGLTSLKSLYIERQQIQQRLVVQQSEMVSQEAALALRRSELDERAAKVEADRAENDARAARAWRQEDEFRAEVERLRAAMEGERTVLDSRRAELDGRCLEVNAAKAGAEGLADDLTRRAASLETGQREWDGTVQAREAALAERGRRSEEIQAEVERERAAIERRQSELSARHKRLEEASSAQAEAARLSEQSTLARASELEALQADIASESEALRRSRTECAAREAALQSRERAMSEAAAQHEDLGPRLEAAIATKDEIRAELGLVRSRNAEVFEEYEAIMATERTECVRATNAEASLTNDVERLAGAIDVFKNRLAEARETEEALRVEVEQANARPTARGPGGPAWSQGRRSRLRKYRDLVHDHAMKVRKASEGLSKRFEQCEQVLGQRAELAAIRERVIEADRRSQRRVAGSRAVVAVFCGIVGLSLLAALSWAVAREVAPARFVAEAILVAEGRGRELNDAEKAEWQRFHEAMIKDPLFHQAAAERFKRQGSMELASAPGVSELVTTSVSTESLADGELRVRLEGAGADKTARTLDTFSASLASFANASQQRRIDGGATKISREAEAGDTPVDHSRTIYALLMLAVAGTLSLGTTIGLWRRLSRVKTEFEQDEQVAMTLEEARWMDPSRRR